MSVFFFSPWGRWASRPHHLFTVVVGIALALIAVGMGSLIGYLPLIYSLGAATALILTTAALLEPASGLGLAIILGPTKSFLAIAYPGWPLDLGQLFFGLAAAGWLGRQLALRNLNVPRSSLWLPLGLYLAANCCSLLPATDLNEAAKEILKWSEIALGALLVAAEARRGKKQMRLIIAAILLSGMVQAGIGLWQYGWRGEGPEHFRILGDHYRAYGSFEQPNPYSGFLGLIWPLALGLAWGGIIPWLSGESQRQKGTRFLQRLSHIWGLVLIAGLCLTALYVSFSRGAWLGAAAALAAILFALPRRRLTGLLLLAATLAGGGVLVNSGYLPANIAARLQPDQLASLTTLADARGANINEENFSTLERAAHWQAALAMSRSSPWLGVGVGNYAVVYARFALINWPQALGHAHMLYLNILAESGLLGLVTYLLLWGVVIGLTIRLLPGNTNTYRGLLIGLSGCWAHLSIHHLVDNLYVNNVHLLIAIQLGLLIVIEQHSSDIPPNDIFPTLPPP